MVDKYKHFKIIKNGGNRNGSSKENNGRVRTKKTKKLNRYRKKLEMEGTYEMECPLPGEIAFAMYEKVIVNNFYFRNNNY